MAAISETASVRLLRPLLDVPPGRLRAVLAARGLAWAEDPTNADARFTRARLRRARGDVAGDGPATRAWAASAGADGQARRTAERDLAAWLAAAVTIRPEGFALLPEGVWPLSALAALLRMITGAAYPPPPAAIATIAAAPARAIGGGLCLGGARLLPAGRLGPGFLLCREAAAMEGPVAAVAGAAWDGRFRRRADQPALPGETIGSLGADSRRFRDISDLPAVVLETLPAYRAAQDGRLIAVPALLWPGVEMVSARFLLFNLRRPAIGGLFRPNIEPM
jgi:tRNA(Ile)-lysidine synthase